MGKKLGCFVVFSIFKNTILLANFYLIFATFWYLIGGSSGAEASGSNRRVLSLVTLVGARAVWVSNKNKEQTTKYDSY